MAFCRSRHFDRFTPLTSCHNAVDSSATNGGVRIAGDNRCARSGETISAMFLFTGLRST